MRIDELDRKITQSDIDTLEKFADKLFAKVGIDVEFTHHFMQRVNDERNIKPITVSELVRLFKQEFKKWGKPIANLGPDAEAVMIDLATDINMPFALDWNEETKELMLVAKTIMRKKDFKTNDREFTVEELNEAWPVWVWPTILATGKAATKFGKKVADKAWQYGKDLVRAVRQIPGADAADVVSQASGAALGAAYAVDKYLSSLNDKEVDKDDVLDTVDETQTFSDINELGTLQGLSDIKPITDISDIDREKMNDNPTQVATWIGAQSDAWNDITNATAQQMELANKSSEEIWKQTQNIRGLDGVWRQEISDQNATLDPSFYTTTDKPIGAKGPSNEHKLTDILQHDELFKAYPDLYKNMKVVYWDNANTINANGGIVKGKLSGNTIYVGKYRVDGAGGTREATPDELIGLISHEWQHPVHEIEGFSDGGSSASNKNAEITANLSGKLTKKDSTDFDIHDTYNSYGGEYDARETERRRDYTDQQRKDNVPFNRSKDEIITIQGNTLPTNITDPNAVVTNTTDSGDYITFKNPNHNGDWWKHSEFGYFDADGRETDLYKNIGGNNNNSNSSTNTTTTNTNVTNRSDQQLEDIEGLTDIGDVADISDIDKAKLKSFINQKNKELKNTPINLDHSKDTATWIGKNSNVWNDATSIAAQKLERQGYTPEDIWKKTQNIRGLDGVWRQEVSDQNATLDPSFYTDSQSGIEHKLTDILQHDKLFKAYPDLYDDMKVVYWDNSAADDIGTSAYVKSNTIYVGKYVEDDSGLQVKRSPTDLIGSISHEWQHPIEDKEEWADGGMSASKQSAEITANLKANGIKDATGKDFSTFDTYYSYGGEGDSRETRRRLNYTDLERTDNVPKFNYASEITTIPGSTLPKGIEDDNAVVTGTSDHGDYITFKNPNYDSQYYNDPEWDKQMGRTSSSTTNNQPITNAQPSARPTEQFKGIAKLAENTLIYLIEGGAMPGVGAIHIDEINPTLVPLEKELGIDLQNNTLGSVGKRQFSGDIDVALQVNTEDLPAFVEKLEKSKLIYDIARSSVIMTRVKIQNYDANRKTTEPRTGFVQLDFMPGDPGWLKTFYHTPHENDSKYKGVFRNIMIAAIAANHNPMVDPNTIEDGRPVSADRFMWSPRDGLVRVKRTPVPKKSGDGYTKKNSNKIIEGPWKQPNEIAQTLGLESENDLDSFETLYKAVKKNLSNAEQEKIFTDFAGNSAIQDVGVPPEVQEFV